MPRSKLLKIPFLHELLQAHPFVVVDVGTTGGMSGKWPSIGVPLRYVGFEPDETEHARLVARSDPSRETYIKMAVGGAKGEVDFHVTRMQACSSVLAPNADFVAAFRPGDFDVVKTVRLQVDTLDRLLNDARGRESGLLKLDTQGSELDILKGAERLSTTYSRSTSRSNSSHFIEGNRCSAMWISIFAAAALNASTSIRVIGSDRTVITTEATRDRLFLLSRFISVLAELRTPGSRTLGMRQGPHLQGGSDLFNVWISRLRT